MARFRRLTAQSRPSGTTAGQIYSPPDYTTATDLRVIVCNTSASAATFRLFHDDDGTTYSEATALYWDKSVSSGDAFVIDVGIDMDNSAGSLGARTDTANALTFTVYGEENEDVNQ